MNGKFLGGEEIKGVLPNCSSELPKIPLQTLSRFGFPGLAKKVAAGVEFIQTQCIFNVKKFGEWMKGVVDTRSS